jgi:hypothetical protein
VSILVVDKAGRRVLLLLSGVIMSMSMASIGAFFFLFSDPDTADLELRDRFYETLFRPQTFWINFHPQI